MIGGRVQFQGKTIGKATASAYSPYLQCGIGYVLLDDPEISLGTEVWVDGIDGSRHLGRLVELPFYDVDKAIPRGRQVSIPKRPQR